MAGYRVAAIACLVMGACYSPGVFICLDSSNCVDGGKAGICQPSGFCSYPDPECASGQRYDDLAGKGLAATCVDVEADESSSSSSGSSSGSSSTTPDESSDDTAPVPVCIDEDGDGFGEGVDCMGSDCDDDNPGATDDCVYMGPGGDDMAAGTRDAPWLTFAHALGSLTPGMSLVLLSGDYTHDVHGRFFPECDVGTAARGTAANPIFVRADEERGAHIKTNGQGIGIELRECDYWRLRGLQVSSADAPGASSTILLLSRQTSNAEFRRMLLHTDNRYQVAPMVWETGGGNNLFEDFEIYDFIGNAMTVSSTVRRAYVNDRGRPGLPGCIVEDDPDVPECPPSETGTGLTSWGAALLVENSIFENAYAGVIAHAVEDAAVLGSAVINSVFGVIHGMSGDAHPTDTRIENLVVLGCTNYATYLRSAIDATVRNVTAIDCDRAFVANLDADVPCPNGCSASGANNLAIDALGDAFFMTGDYSGFFTHNNAAGSVGNPYVPTADVPGDDADFWRQSMTMPVEGISSSECIAYVPEGNAMKGIGENADDIGANILYRYVDGELTTESLWDPETGAFPCGAVIEGVNDDRDTSCIGVHERLNVGTAACPLPY